MPDKNFLANIIRKFPEQIKQSLVFAKGVKVNGKFDKLVVCGMGGSALPVDILRCYLEDKKIYLPIVISRGYSLPLGTDKKSLVFISSYSGNTEESLACFTEAKKKGYKIIGFSKGGKVKELCQKAKLPYVEYPEDGPDFQPRFGLGYAFSAMLLVLGNSKVIKNCASDLVKLASELKPADLEAVGRGLAERSQKKVPVFYSSAKYGEAVARICKININENGKTQAFWNVLPEMNHNEMIGYTVLVGNYHVIILKDLKDHERVIKRMEITAQILREKGMQVSTIEMSGKTTLEKIFKTILVSSWLSYYLALSYGLDPVPVAMVEDFKKRMA